MARRDSPSSSISGNSQSATSFTSGDSEIDWPFGARLDTLRHSEIRETAYEIFFMCCRFSPGFAGKGAIAYVASGGDVVEAPSSTPSRAVIGPKGGTGMMVVTSRVKSTLGLRARRPPPMRTMNSMGLTSMAIGSGGGSMDSPGRNTVPSSPGRIRRPMTSLLPPLTRCNQDSRLTKLWNKAKPCTSGTDTQQVVVGGGAPAATTPAAGDTRHPRPSTSRGTQRLYIRINTLHYLHSHIHSIDKSLTFFSRGGSSTHPVPSPANFRHHHHHHQLHPNRRLTPATHFDLIRASIQVSMQRVSEVAAYRLIFLDSGNSFYSGLYTDDVAGCRIDNALRVLKQNLNLLLTVLTDRMQPLAMKEVMLATFQAFLMVLLAGGPDRAFVRTDYEIVNEDFQRLKKLFCSSGEGLVPEDVVDREAEVVEGIIGLMGLPTERLIEDFTIAACESSSVAGGLVQGQRLLMPPTTGNWNRSDPNTVLRVICHRNDDTANNFLKKAFQLPKRR